MEISLQDVDFLHVAKVRADEEPLFALQVKCMALIRMLEEKDHDLAVLQEKYRELSPQGKEVGK